MCFVQVLKWSDYCLPLAYSPSQPFRVVAQTSLENFSLLGVAFIEDRLHLDDGLVPSKIVRMLLSVVRNARSRKSFLFKSSLSSDLLNNF